PGVDLVVPEVAAAVGVEGDDGGEVEVVAAAGAAPLRVVGAGVARAEVDAVELGVEGDAVPDGAAGATLPVLTAPGARRGFHGRIAPVLLGAARHRVEAP